MMEFLPTVKRQLAAGVLIALASGAAAQQAYPSKPIRFILPNAPGGSNSFVAPVRTPKVIVNKLADEITRIQAMPDFREKLATQGVEPFVNGPEEFAAFIKAEMAKYAKIIKLANIKIE